MSGAPDETVYDASSHRQALWAVAGWRQMFVDLWQSRELIGRLAARDIAVRYRNAFLGLLWAVIVPLATVALFTFLTSKRVLPIGAPPIPYPAFALSSLIVWQLFGNTLAACTASLAGAGSLVTKSSFPKESLVFGAVGQPLLDFAIKLPLVAAAFLYYGVTPDWSIVLLPLILLPAILLATGLGFLFSIANLLTRDVGNLVGMFVTFGMFAAPVLYPPPVRAPFDLVNYLNPVSPTLIAVQDVLAHGAMQRPALFAAGAVFSLAVFLVGWRVFRVAIVRVAERA
ncbi:MAG: ABC transporter permease [Chromatiales bacterium]|nr:ABC transporter permease [Chromatiales bacterium]